MRSFIFCVVGLLRCVVIAPTTCPAQGFCCPPFPLPSALEVGDGWTYSIVDYIGGHWSDSKIVGADTLFTDTQTVSVVERLQLENQT